MSQPVSTLASHDIAQTEFGVRMIGLALVIMAVGLGFGVVPTRLMTRAGLFGKKWAIDRADRVELSIGGMVANRLANAILVLVGAWLLGVGALERWPAGTTPPGGVIGGFASAGVLVLGAAAATIFVRAEPTHDEGVDQMRWFVVGAGLIAVVGLAAVGWVHANG